MRSGKYICFGIFLLVLAFLLAACQKTEPCPDCPQPVPCPPIEPCPECEPCMQPVVAQVPYEAQWAASGHADATAEAFRHWDEDGSVEMGCATCHSATGYQDFLGADSSAVGTIENTHPIGNGLTCITCHNDAATSLTSITFPSGVNIVGIGEAARCMLCHQGRSAGNRLESAYFHGNGRLSWLTKCKYDRYNNLIESRVYKSNRIAVLSRYNYRFDATGNWVVRNENRKVYVNILTAGLERANTVTERIIEYY